MQCKDETELLPDEINEEEVASEPEATTTTHKVSVANQTSVFSQ